MASSVVVAGLGMVSVGVIGRTILKYAPRFGQTLEKRIVDIKKMNLLSFDNAKYYKGGFESKMTIREAALVLGVSPNASKIRIKEAHKKLMIQNHPDRGGSPYLATKVNEAKDILDKQSK